MYYIKLTILLFSLVASLNSCLDDSHIPFEGVNTNKTIIEAIITDTDTIQTVLVSRTNFKEEGNNLPIEGADVYVTNSAGELFSFFEETPGVYKTYPLRGQINETYKLEVNINDTLYTATEKMISRAIIDSGSVEYIENDNTYHDGYHIILYVQRYTDTTNYYKISTSVNDSLYSGYEDITIYEDSYTPRQQHHTIPYPFELNDTVNIKVYSISENIYDYFFTFNKITNEGINSINSIHKNPPTNISNNCLGYFQVSAIYEIEVIIEE